MTEGDEAKFRRKMVRENPHIVDAFFYDRVENLLSTFFGKKGIEMSWHWFRIEHQARGTAHVHGCLRMKNDPGLSELAHVVLEGRIAAKRLRLSGTASS